MKANGKANRKAAAGETHGDSALQIAFNDAVTEGRKLLADIKQRTGAKDWRLGELADTIEPLYGEKTLNKFAKQIGVSACTLERCRSVWSAWKNIPEPAPKSFPFAIAMALQGCAKAAAPFILEKPAMTRAEARELARKLSEAPAKTASTTDPETQSDSDAAAQVSEAEPESESKPDLSSGLVKANKATGLAEDIARGLEDPEYPATVELLNRCLRAAEAFTKAAQLVERRLRSEAEPPRPDTAQDAPTAQDASAELSEAA